MKIHVQIDHLVLHGFEYHDHLRIGNAIKNELYTIIKEKGVPPTKNMHQTISNLSGISLDIEPNALPSIIGTRVARSIYTAFDTNLKKH